MEYAHRDIEPKWQQWWEDHQIYKVENDITKPKFYILDMFPYPSGAGLHVGHPLGYIASDILSRYKRMNGYNVLHPMGFDAFGLPAEQYAIQTGVHPAESTQTNIARYRDQLRNLGFNYDWSREVLTSDPSYYRWTQWIFLRLYHHWYDEVRQTARPIHELVIHFEKAGTEGLAAACSELIQFSAAEWINMSAKEKDDILMNYRLAYRKISYVNWCEALGTVLANDEVKDGVSERGGFPVERKPMLQWSLRITAYAERLLNDLEALDWSDALKTMQRNWIGRSEGAHISFSVVGSDYSLNVFTTRPDTIYGATFMVIAPEHEMVGALTTTDHYQEVQSYLAYTQTRSERERMAEVKQMTGVFTGMYARHPFTGDQLPIWISEYVLKDYGTGVIMAVPAEDVRDRLFAEKFHLPILEIIDRREYPDARRTDKTGRMINSGFLNGMDVREAIREVISRVKSEGIGDLQVNYKLRDALFSRQRYWGEPFPIYYDREGISYALSDDALPLTLPSLDNFQPTADGQSPLARVREWVEMTGGFLRETDTMPGYAGSSWYFLRYMDADNETAFASRKALDYWKDVDLYIGGTEHAVGHLMYARFWQKFLFDLGLVNTAEPFRKLVNQGMIQGIIETIYLSKEKVDGHYLFRCTSLLDSQDVEGYIAIPVPIEFVKDYGSEDSYLDIEGVKRFVEWRPEYADAVFECAQGRFIPGSGSSSIPENCTFKLRTQSEVGKMSKSKYNVINPDDVVDVYGADCFRMYEMFLGPIEQSKPWDTKGIDGVAKFLKRFWGMYNGPDGTWLPDTRTPDREMLRVLHQTIKKVGEDIERLSMNTCVSHFMICVNELRRLNCQSWTILEPLIRLIAPFAPHMAEELWHSGGGMGSVHHAPYPQADHSMLVKDTVVYPISINGKKRGELETATDTSTVELEAAAIEVREVAKWLEGMTVRKIIIVPGRMINIVAN